MTQEFALPQGRTTIGRAAANDLAIPADPRVGRHHASIVEEAGRYVIHDMDSAFRVSDCMAMLARRKIVASETMKKMQASTNPDVRAFFDARKS